MNSNAKARRAMVGQPHPTLAGNIWQTNLFHNCIIMANIIATQEREGYAKGEASGFAKGKTEGYEEGEAAGELKVARAMKAKGMTINEICEITGFKRSQVEEL